MNKVARSDEVSTWCDWKKWKQWRKVARDEKTPDELLAHTVVVNKAFNDFIDLGARSHDVIVYVHMIDPDLFDEIGEAHRYMRDQRIKMCQEKYPNQVVVVDGASLVHSLDALPHNIREEKEWHRSCDH